MDYVESMTFAKLSLVQGVWMSQLLRLQISNLIGR